jgi:Lrp/AsnC family transcriptional regulator, regulator for asnA, asnC and gidA
LLIRFAIEATNRYTFGSKFQINKRLLWKIINMVEEGAKTGCALDDIDRRILNELLQNARKPFTELAEEIGVSSGTVHVRINKLKDAGVIKGARLVVNFETVGYAISAYIGITLRNASDYPKVLARLRTIDRILEAHYTTGHYNIFTKILAKNISDLYQFLLELQQIKEIQNTETIMILDSPIQRELRV